MFYFRRMGESDQAMVLAWRTSPRVTRYMNTDVHHSLEDQKRWFRKISQDPLNKYWIIELQEDRVPIGVIHLSDMDLQNRRTSWGFYVGSDEHLSLGGFVPPYLYNYLFHHPEWPIGKVLAEVLEGNERTIKLHLLHGYREVGVYRNHIYKNDECFDMYLLELHRQTWLEQKRFRKHTAVFED